MTDEESMVQCPHCKRKRNDPLIKELVGVKCIYCWAVVIPQDPEVFRSNYLKNNNLPHKH